MEWRLHFTYIQCYFISIATILGTGVLGLPITLYKAGFYPFLLTFTLGFIMQVFVIIQFVEILQYCKAVLNDSRHMLISDVDDDSVLPLLLNRGKKEEEHVLFDIRNRTEPNDSKSSSDDEGFESTKGEESVLDSLESDIIEPNLHIIGKLFLNKFLNFIYLLVVIVHFMAILISYSLAGSQAFGQVFNIDYIKIIPLFTWILSIIIIVARRQIQPVIALMTCVKGTLLCATILVTMYTGVTVNRTISDDWNSVQGPYLMGIVAVGGVPNVMPMLFERFEMVQDQMKAFRLAIIGGISTCYVLNVLWCWAVLKIVPQLISDCDLLSVLRNNHTTTTTTSLLGNNPVSTHICDPEATLEAAEAAGQISTVPLSKIILSDHVELHWIASVIQYFILISITVSFLTVGSALQHTVSGWADDFISGVEKCKMTWTCWSCLPRNWFWHYAVGLLCFLGVFLVAWSDPKGFVAILEKLVSLGLSLMCGPFMFLLLRTIRSKPYRQIRISLPTSEWLKNTRYVTLLYFTVGIFYDVISSVIEYVHRV